jgi:hypothetical protein
VRRIRIYSLFRIDLGDLVALYAKPGHESLPARNSLNTVRAGWSSISWRAGQGRFDSMATRALRRGFTRARCSAG